MPDGRKSTPLKWKKKKGPGRGGKHLQTKSRREERALQKKGKTSKEVKGRRNLRTSPHLGGGKKRIKGRMEERSREVKEKNLPPYEGKNF